LLNQNKLERDTVEKRIKGRVNVHSLISTLQTKSEIENKERVLRKKNNEQWVSKKQEKKTNKGRGEIER